MEMVKKLKLSELNPNTEVIYFYDKADRYYEDGMVMTAEELRDMLINDKTGTVYFKDSIGVYIANKIVKEFCPDTISLILDREEDDGTGYDGWAYEMMKYLEQNGGDKLICEILNLASRQFPYYEYGEEVEVDCIKLEVCLADGGDYTSMYGKVKRND